MTFEKATKLKKSVHSHFVNSNIKYNVKIVPKNTKDYKKFIEDYRMNTKIKAQSYTSKNEFEVIGLWTDGINILKCNLTN